MNRAITPRDMRMARAYAPPFTDKSIWQGYSAYTLSRPPVVVAPFDDGPIIRNLMYHVWPVKGDMWRWNIQELLRRIDIFNGKRVVAIVVDNESDSADAVTSLLDGHGCTFFVANNDPLAEGITYPYLLSAAVSPCQDQNEVTFYGHAKGVSHEPDVPEQIRKWSEMQYRVCLDDWVTVRNHLSRYVMTGPFKRIGYFNAHHRLDPWHYSGTFFWMRNAAMFNGYPITKVPPIYGSVEVWPGVWFKTEETGCLFMPIDSKDIPAPYRPEFWESPTMAQAIAKWSSDAFAHSVPAPPDLVHPVWDNPRTEQHPGELNWFIDQLLDDSAHPRVQSILTIGAYSGGVEYHIARRFREASRSVVITTIEKRMSADVRDTQRRIGDEFDHFHIIIEGSSTDPAVVDKLAAHYDAVFIDGDHSYWAARSDWLLARKLTASVVGFHDIVTSDWHTQARCCVDKLWREIRQEASQEGYMTEECIVGPGVWGGIGLVRFPS